MQLVALRFQIVEVLPDAFHLVAAFPNQLLHVVRQFLKRTVKSTSEFFMASKAVSATSPIPVCSRVRSPPASDFAIRNDQVAVVAQDVAEALHSGQAPNG